LRDYFGELDERAPQLMMDWIASIAAARASGVEPATLNVVRDARQLIVTFSSQTDEGEWLLMLREESEVAQMENLMAAFKLTMREAEVLYWLVKGKTSRDIGSILGTSPRTVNKHLEHVFEKMGVETRTAAAARAIDKMRGNTPRNVAG
jgi:DNA-binding CsgD family transcriptional regulator